MEKAREGEKLNGEESAALYDELMGLKTDLAALRMEAIAKNSRIDGLEKDNEELARLSEEAGSKAYLMLDGVVGFEESLPEFGVGLTIGTRIGNSLMLEAGADYMIGGMSGIRSFSLDNFQFRAGLGWMF